MWGDGDALLDVYLVPQIREFGLESALCLLAVWAIGLGEDYDFVVGDGIFDGIFDGLLIEHGCYGRGGWGFGEESAEGSVKYALEHRTG